MSGEKRGAAQHSIGQVSIYDTLLRGILAYQEPDYVLWAYGNAGWCPHTANESVQAVPANSHIKLHGKSCWCCRQARLRR